MLWYFSLINVPRCYILCNVQQTFKLGGCQDKHKSINKYFGFNGLSYKLLLHLAINILRKFNSGHIFLKNHFQETD